MWRILLVKVQKGTEVVSLYVEVIQAADYQLSYF